MGTSGAAAPAQSSAPVVVAPVAEPTDQFMTLGELEQRHIFAAVERSKGNRPHAAKMLDISIRTLRNKLNEYSGKTKEATSSDSEAEPD